MPCYPHWQVIESWLGTLTDHDIDWYRTGQVLGIVVNEVTALKSCVIEHELGKTHPDLAHQLDAIAAAMDKQWSNPLWASDPDATPNTNVPKDSPEYQASLVHCRELALTMHTQIQVVMQVVDAHAVFGMQ